MRFENNPLCSAGNLQLIVFCFLRNGGFQDRYHGHLPRHDPEVGDGKTTALLFADIVTRRLKDLEENEHKPLTGKIFLIFFLRPSLEAHPVTSCYLGCLPVDLYNSLKLKFHEAVPHSSNEGNYIMYSIMFDT